MLAKFGQQVKPLFYNEPNLSRVLFSNLEYLTKDLEADDVKLLQHWNKRAKQFGKKNISDAVASTSLSFWCTIVGVEKDQSINNMWARKTFVHCGLRELQLPAGSMTRCYYLKSI